VALFDNIFAVARAVNNRIVFSEGHDPRVVKAAIMAIRDGLAMPILIGQRSRILREIKIHGAFSSCITIVDPGDTGTNNFYAEAYSKLPQYEGIALATAKRAVADPLILAALMVRLGKAEGTISGAVATTADTIRAAIQIIGPGPEVACVSSFFLMLLDQPHHPKQGIMCFADCGLIVEPSVSELAQIAVSTAESFQVLTGETPRIAMLSFSTNGSARHERARRMIEATALVQSIKPDLLIDGEIQFDAAIIPDVAAAKSPGSPLHGNANIFVFPSLEAANIGYKIAQRVGGVTAIGPVVQGLAKPANDLSRGCSIQDIYQMIAVTCAQANRGKMCRALE